MREAGGREKEGRPSCAFARWLTLSSASRRAAVSTMMGAGEDGSRWDGRDTEGLEFAWERGCSRRD